MKRLTWFFIAAILSSASAHAQVPIKPLLKKLDSKVPGVRFDALMTLADLGPGAALAADRIARILTEFDEDDRTAATIALGKIGRPALPFVVKLLAHQDEAVRYNAVWALGLIGPDAKANVPRLLKHVENDPDEEVRVKAVFALGKIASNDAATLQALAKMLNDEKMHFAVRMAIVGQLSQWGETSIPHLGAMLRTKDFELRADEVLAEVLEKHKTPASAKAMLPFVVDAYARADERRSVYYPRNASAPLAALASNLCDGEGMSYVLSTVGGKVLESLEKDLRGKDAAARVAACKHLGQMGRTLLMHQEGPEMVERIVKALLPLIKHEDGDVREALAVNMPVTKSSTPGVEELQRDRDIKVGHAARMTLMAYGVDDAMPRLFDLLKKAPSAEQLRAAEALLHSEEALTVVWDALKSKDPALKHHAAYIIGARQALGKRTWEEVNEMVAPILVASLKSNDPLKRREAAEGLEKWGIQLDSVHVPAFVAAIKDKDAKVRFAAIYVLRSHSGEPHAKTVLPAVEPFLTDPDFDTRIAAVHVFGNSGAPGLPRLLEAFAKEKDAVTRLYMIRTFQQQSGDQRVYDALLKAAENPEDWPEASQALFRSQEKKAFPKLIELMCKKDEAMRKTFADLPEQTWTAVSAAKAVAPLLKKDDIDVNRRAAQTLEQLTPFLMADSGWWVPPIQQALGERLPKVRSLLQSKNPKARLAAVTLLVQFKSMQQFLHQHVHNRPSNDPKLRVEVVDRYQTNQQTISTLLLMARYDAELAVRRMARKSMLSDIMPVTPWGFP